MEVKVVRISEKDPDQTLEKNGVSRSLTLFLPTFFMEHNYRWREWVGVGYQVPYFSPNKTDTK